MGGQEVGWRVGHWTGTQSIYMVDGVLEELMDEGGQGGSRSSRRCQAI